MRNAGRRALKRRDDSMGHLVHLRRHHERDLDRNRGGGKWALIFGGLQKSYQSEPLKRSLRRIQCAFSTVRDFSISAEGQISAVY